MRWPAYRDQGDLPCVVSNECQVRLDVGEGTVFLADAGEDAEQEVVFGLAGQQGSTSTANSSASVRR